MNMINVCMKDCSKAVGLTALSFCLGMIAGLFLPLAAVAVIEMALLVIIGWLCLFKW